MQAKATVKYIRTSPRKMRRVVDMIRGQHVAEARRIRESIVRALRKGAIDDADQRRVEVRHQ